MRAARRARIGPFSSPERVQIRDDPGRAVPKGTHGSIASRQFVRTRADNTDIASTSVFGAAKNAFQPASPICWQDLAIVSTYVPAVIEGLSKADTEASASVSAPAEGAQQASGDRAEASASPSADEPVSLGMVSLSLALVLTIACVAPFLAGLENIMGLLIIGFGLYEAWKINKRSVLSITGPHTLASRPIRGAAAGLAAASGRPRKAVLLVLLLMVALARAAFGRAPADADHGAFTLYAFLTIALSFLSVAYRTV